MTYHYGKYWAEILPIRSSRDGSVRYWNYRIYQSRPDQFLFDGHDTDLASAHKSVEVHIDRLIGESLPSPRAA